MSKRERIVHPRIGYLLGMRTQSPYQPDHRVMNHGQDPFRWTQPPPLYPHTRYRGNVVPIRRQPAQQPRRPINHTRHLFWTLVTGVWALVHIAWVIRDRHTRRH